MFAAEDRDRLLVIARRALEARVRRERDPVHATGGALDIRCGAFVSIHSGAELRGCLGRIEPDWAVARVVHHLGRAVADSDPRFPPVSVDELGGLSIELSLLAPAEEFRAIGDVEIGRHGLIVELGRARGLLLPQVAAEHSWDVETFLAHTCLKASLRPDAWQSGARVLMFEAEVFGEESERRPEIV